MGSACLRRIRGHRLLFAFFATPGEALRKIKALVAAGEFVITAHVERDHPERKIRAGEVAAAIAGAFEIHRQDDRAADWLVIGPASRPPARLCCAVAIEERAVIITVWRRAR